MVERGRGREKERGGGVVINGVGVPVLVGNIETTLSQIVVDLAAYNMMHNNHIIN